MENMDNQHRQPTVIDLFAGCGGLSLGLHLAGWKGLFAVEKSPHAFETLKYNLIDKLNHFEWPAWLTQEAHDINELLKNYEKELIKLRGTVNLVAGGPPCQGFSMAGKRVKKDIRNNLVFSYIKFIEFVQPKIILFENVKGFTYAFDKTENNNSIPYSDIVIKRLEALGYDIKANIIDFSEFGVPQRRKRFILVGVKDGKAKYFEKNINELKLEFLKNKGITHRTSLEEAISDLLQKHGESNTPDRKNFKSGLYGKAVSNYQRLMRGNRKLTGMVADSHSFANHNKGTIECFSNLIKYYPIKGKRIENKEREKWGVKKRGITVLCKNSVAPTLTSHPDDYVHYCEPRIMTVREYARIQTFPDWYEIKGKYTTGGKLRKTEVPRYTQIGNAIPPLFAELAGLALKKI